MPSSIMNIEITVLTILPGADGSLMHGSCLQGI